MSFVTWLKQSPFSTPWFDAILFGVLLFEVLPFFLRARAARYSFTAASLLEYRLFDREETIAECKVKAEEAAKIAEERAVEFVLPIAKSAEPPAKDTTEGGDNAQ